MEEEVVPKTENVVPKRKTALLDVMMFILIIIAIVALGTLGVNQYMKLKYNAYLLTAPCDLCRELNPDLDLCPKDMDAWRKQVEDKYNKNTNNQFRVNWSNINITPSS